MNQAGTYEPYPHQTTGQSTPTILHAQAIEIRDEHFKTERSIRSLGLFYLVVGGFVFLSGGLMSFGLLDESSRAQGAWVEVVMPIAFVWVVAMILIAVGKDLRALKSSVSLSAKILSGISLVFFPFGTLIGVLGLTKLCSAKGNYVLSDDYKDVVSASLDYKPKSSLIVPLLFGAFLFGAILLVVFLKIVADIDAR